jgi:hypothetical protein
MIQREKEITNLKLPALKLFIPLVELTDLFTIEKENDKIQLNNLSSNTFKCNVCFKLSSADVFLEKILMRQHIGQHMVQCHIPPTKIYVAFVVRFVVQTMKFHTKPNDFFLYSFSVIFK